MQNAIILHGKPDRSEYYDLSLPSESNSHWLPWLQAQLTKRDIIAATPEVPMAFDPDYEIWCREVERFDIGPMTKLVGHSCGGGFWLRYLSEHKDLKVGKVVLVAPSLGFSWDDGTEKFYGNFTLDEDMVSRTDGITIFGSDNDGEGIKSAIQKITSTVKGVEYREFHNYGHFCYDDMKKHDFPELLAELLATNQ